jgi:hypothetical protein
MSEENIQTTEQRKLFDMSKLMRARIPSPASPDGFKRITVRYPSDKEWCERLRKQQTVMRQLGRGESETEVLNGEVIDAELFRRVRIDEGGVEVDDFEASAIMTALAGATCTAVERAGSGFRVNLTVYGDVRVSHLMRMPSIKQIADYNKGTCRAIDGRHNVTNLRLSLEPAGALYDALADDTEGYCGAVPIIHKAAVVKNIKAELDNMMGEPDPEA